MNTGFVEILREFGLGVFLSLSIFFVMFWLVKNVMKDHFEERKNYQSIIQNHLVDSTKMMDKVADKIQEHDQNQQEVNRYNREEHQAMLNVLVKLNNK